MPNYIGVNRVGGSPNSIGKGWPGPPSSAPPPIEWRGLERGRGKRLEVHLTPLVRLAWAPLKCSTNRVEGWGTGEGVRVSGSPNYIEKGWPGPPSSAPPPI